MLEALPSNSPGSTPGKWHNKSTHPGGVAFKLPQCHLWIQFNFDIRRVIINYLSLKLHLKNVRNSLYIKFLLCF
ncbi:MAG TPA: hypothetical protein DDW27_05760 [Bacteroidales bacterium]|nr:hypothetical protein [Bacteroidales bacterium]